MCVPFQARLQARGQKAPKYHKAFMFRLNFEVDKRRQQLGLPVRYGVVTEKELSDIQKICDRMNFSVYENGRLKRA